MSNVRYPLKFFVRNPEVQNIMASNPAIMIDAATPPTAYAIVSCSRCQTGMEIVREEVDEKWRYYCSSCHQVTDLFPEIEAAAKAWETLNLSTN